MADFSSRPAFEQWIQRQADQLGVPSEFLADLMTAQEDWAKIIRLHALLEAAITAALISYIDHVELADLIGRLQIRTKVQWAVRLQLLGSTAADFVEALSSIRNTLLHDVRSIPGFTINAAVRSLSTENRRKLLPNGRDTEHFAADWPLGIWAQFVATLEDCDAAGARLSAARKRQFTETLKAERDADRDALLRMLDSL